MKSPLWILNSAFAILLLVLIAIIFIFRPQRPARTSLTPTGTPPIGRAETPTVDPSQIYKNDLFDTHAQEPGITPQEAQPKKTVVPTPPAPRQAVVTTPPVSQFAPPLAISLKGVMYSPQDAYNRAIIADNKTKKEGLYKIGDKIVDAEIIHIGSNKVMFMRSNGQQETIFVTHDDAQADPIYNQRSPWDALVKKSSDTEFIIYQEPLSERITNLAQLLDMLDITTAFHQGKILGCRIGNISQHPLGGLLGLKQGDVITAINGIPTTNTKNRVAIYQALKDRQDNDQTVKVKVIRQGQELELTYQLSGHKTETAREEHKEENKPVTIANEQARMPDYVSNVQQLQKRDRHAMFNHGGRRSLLETASLPDAQP